MSPVNLIASPVADRTPNEPVGESKASSRPLRLCVLSHPRYNEVAGHLPEYLATMVQEACSRGWSVNLLVPPKLCDYVEKAEEGRQTKLLLSPLWPTAHSTGGAEPSVAQARIKGWIATIRAYYVIAVKCDCDHLLIIDGDQNHTAFAIGLVALPLLRCGVSTVVFGSLNGITKNNDHSGQSLKQKASLSVVRRFFRLKRFRGIITTNPALASSHQSLPKKPGKKSAM